MRFSVQNITVYLRGLRTIDKKKLLLGIDIGTSSIKFSVADTQLKEYYSSSIKYKYNTLNKDWAEIDPNIWTCIIEEEMKKIFKLSFASQIVCICPTAQMHTLVFLDEKNLPVRKAIMWNDRRTKGSISKLKKELENNLDLSYNANIISTGSPLANLLWLKEKELEVFNQVHKICMCKDYVNSFLTGKVVTDYCDASTSCLMDLDKRVWSKKLCDYYGIDIQILPIIQEATDLVGMVKKEVVKKLSMPNPLPVFTGTGDNAATVLATKYCDDSKLVLSLGTSGVVLAENQDLSAIGKNILFRYAHKEIVISQTSLSTGGKSFDWWMNGILNTSEYSSEQNFSEDQIKTNDVLFLPYLSGEKYLYKNPNLSGSFYNLSLENSRLDLNLAVLEGVTFALKYLYMKTKNDEKKLNELILLGGGSKSDSWANIVADIFDCPIIRYEDSIEAVQGAIIIGIFGLQEEIEISISGKSEIAPNKNLTSHYKNKYHHFCLLSDQMNDFVNILSEERSRQ